MTFQGVDVSELNTLAADLTKAGLLAGMKAFGVAEEYARGTQTDARAFAYQSVGDSRGAAGHAKLYPFSITSDVEVTATGIVAEVGPDKDLPQGALGNILEYGTSEQGPQPSLQPAHDRNLPKALARLRYLGADIL